MVDEEPQHFPLILAKQSSWTACRAIYCCVIRVMLSIGYRDNVQTLVRMSKANNSYYQKKILKSSGNFSFFLALLIPTIQRKISFLIWRTPLGFSRHCLHDLRSLLVWASNHAKQSFPFLSLHAYWIANVPKSYNYWASESPRLSVRGLYPSQHWDESLLHRCDLQQGWWCRALIKSSWYNNLGLTNNTWSCSLHQVLSTPPQ